MNIISTGTDTNITVPKAQRTGTSQTTASASSFSDALAAEQKAETLSNIVNSQLNNMLTQSLFGEGSANGTASSGGGSTMSMLMLLCSALQNGEGDGKDLMAQLLPSITGMGTAQKNTLYESLMGTGYDTNVLDKVGTNVFGKNSISGMPLAQSRPANPPLKSDASNRSAPMYNAVIDQFQVETNGRYQPGKSGGTYCNIFCWDVTKAMGAEIPYYTDFKTGDILHYPDTKGANYMNANEMHGWLLEHGPRYGWHEVTAEQAQKMANAGHPAVTAYKNPDGHGHMQMVRPSPDGKYDPEKGVYIAQAGRRLKNGAYISSIYGKGLSKVKYFAHL